MRQHTAGSFADPVSAMAQSRWLVEFQIEPIYNAHARFKRDDTPRTAAIAASTTQDAAPDVA
jgi:hypothetical protein